MNAVMSQVNEFWKDPKYEEFVSGYKPQIQKCEIISIRYDEWCKRILDPRIEIVINIGTGGGSNIGGDSNRPLSSAEIIARFKKANEVLKNKMAESTPGPQGSGVATPQNDHPRLSPLQMKILRDGKER